LEFELDESELQEFNERVKSNLASNLKLKLSLSKAEARLELLLQGKGKQYLNQKILEIARFVEERIDIQYIPAVRTSDLAVGVVEDMLGRELATLERDAKYKKLLSDLTEAQKPVLEALSTELTKTIASFVPEVRRISVETGSELRRAIRRSCRVMVDDGSVTTLEMKGEGVKSLTAISLMRHISQKARGARGLILAIEEPESHLHPRAVHRLREVLQEIATLHQVIVTTHSPVLVDRGDVRRNIVVESGRAIPARTLRMVRDALGVELSDNLASAQLVLLVEGEHDIRVLRTWLEKLSPHLKSALGNGTLALDHLAGASNLKYKVAMYKNLLCNTQVFLDNDEAGRDAVQGALDARVLDQTEYSLTVCQGMANSELEDLIVEGCYAQPILSAFGVALNPKFMASSKKAWSDRVRDNFQDQGKPWAKPLERQIKEIVASAASAAGPASLNEHRQGPIDALIARLQNRLKPA
jgi:predicted ATP-dependent endonuclease of OLD family